MSTVTPEVRNRIRQYLSQGKPEGGINVGRIGRVISAVSGAALLFSGLSRRSPLGLLLALAGGGLLHRGISGHSVTNALLGIDAARRAKKPDHVAIQAGQGCRVDKSIVIDRSREDLYRFWRDLENLPRIMSHLQAVQQLDTQRSHWNARAPLGRTVAWDADVLIEREPEVISWRSLPGSEVDTAGSVHFYAAPGGGTEVRIELKYDPPAGKVGCAVARMLGEAPEQQIEADLQRFKHIMETGRMPTLAGEPRS
jgi:uncharacterized membrane protein